MEITEKIDSFLNDDNLDVLDEAKYTDELGEFFVVSKPLKTSELEDIFFKTNIQYMMKIAKGGMNPSTIVGIYKNEKRAKDIALKLLKKK